MTPATKNLLEVIRDTVRHMQEAVATFEFEDAEENRIANLIAEEERFWKNCVTMGSSESGCNEED